MWLSALPPAPSALEPRTDAVKWKKVRFYEGICTSYGNGNYSVTESTCQLYGPVWIQTRSVLMSGRFASSFIFTFTIQRLKHRNTLFLTYLFCLILYKINLCPHSIKQGHLILFAGYFRYCYNRPCELLSFTIL